MKRILIVFSALIWSIILSAQEATPEGAKSLFNGQDFTNWKIPEGDNGHWKIIDGVIDYDAESEAEGDKNLWSDKNYRNFVFHVDWRIKETPYINPRVPIILPSGLHKKDENGKPITISVPDSDSGILLRGQGKSQVNIWCWPTGSGEVYGYRMDENMPANVRSAVVPKINADNHIGEWNRYKITVIGEHLTVELNDKTVIKNAWLPDLPQEGPIGLQHHGAKRDGKWVSPPALVQFKNIYVQELPDHIAMMTSHPDSKDWTSLFGDNLADADAPKDVWSINGEGVFTASEDQAIWSKKVYEDYILDLEFMTEDGTNSGVVVHCTNKDDWIPNSLEIQIADDFADKWASSPKTWQCGAIFGRLAPFESAVKRPGEWNRYTIVCQGRMIHVMLNGKWVSHMNMDQWIDPRINPDGTEIPAWLSKAAAYLPEHGYIGLQGKHADASIFFRNVRIKPLSQSEH